MWFLKEPLGWFGIKQVVGFGEGQMGLMELQQKVKKRSEQEHIKVVIEDIDFLSLTSPSEIMSTILPDITDYYWCSSC